jgi:hypothetical protein
MWVLAWFNHQVLTHVQLRSIRLAPLDSADLLPAPDFQITWHVDRSCCVQVGSFVAGLLVRATFAKSIK